MWHSELVSTLVVFIGHSGALYVLIYSVGSHMFNYHMYTSVGKMGFIKPKFSTTFIYGTASNVHKTVAILGLMCTAQRDGRSLHIAGAPHFQTNPY